MALTVEDGTGLAAADSYISLTTANAYHSKRGITAWVGSTPEKEQALVRAAEALDRLYNFVGLRSTQAQGLQWPRTGAVDSDGFAISATTIPTQVQDAQAELAARLLCVDEAPDQAADMANVTSVTETVGRVSVSRSFGAAGAQLPRFPKVNQILRPVLAPRGLRRT